MDREILLRIARDEARRALGLAEEPDLKFEARGSVKEWDEAVHRNVFEVELGVWRRTGHVDIELNGETGEVLSWLDRDRVEATDQGAVTREEAIRIAKSAVKPAEAVGEPDVEDDEGTGRRLVVVGWRIPSTGAEGALESVEVLLHPGTKRVCGVRRH